MSSKYEFIDGEKATSRSRRCAPGPRSPGRVPRVARPARSAIAECRTALAQRIREVFSTRRYLPGRYPGANYRRHRGSRVRAATGDGLAARRPSLLVLQAGEAPDAAAKFQGTSIQVRRWTSLHRFTPLALAALAIRIPAMIKKYGCPNGPQ